MDTLVDQNLDVLAARVVAARRTLDQRFGFARALAEQGQRLQLDIADLKQQIVTLEKAAIVLTSIGEQRQLNAQQQIESLVTRGLQVVFGPQMSFRLVQNVKARQPTVEFLVRTTNPDGSFLETEVMGATGGGLSSIVGFVLRIVILLLSPGKQHVAFFDEPFAALSDGYADKLVEFIKELVEKSPLQIAIVAHTHVQDLAEVADKRYRLSLVESVTEVKEF